jgi:flagellin FlaB
MQKKQKGITGLETAIILIAFVVVAAVFAYTVLSAGLFSSQKSSEAVYAGMEEAESTLKIVGSVIGFEGTTDEVGYIKFTVENALNGEPINFTQPTAGTSGMAAAASTNVVTISYVDKDSRIDDLYWEVSAVGDDDGDMLLEPGEKFEITCPGTTAGVNSFSEALNSAIIAGEVIKLEVTPPVGAVLPIEKTMPAEIDAVMNLP